MSLKSTTQVQHIKGLPFNWEGKPDKVHQLFSKVPLYNKVGAGPERELSFFLYSIRLFINFLWFPSDFKAIRA